MSMSWTSEPGSTGPLTSGTGRDTPSWTKTGKVRLKPVAVERPPRLAYDDSLETPVMLGPGGEMRSLLQKPL